MKKLVALLLACMLILAAAAAMAEPSGTVMLYSSLKEKQLVAVKEAFEAKYPGIVMDYYQAGTGKIKTKIATEQQAGQVAADLLWVGDASDYLTFKEQGILDRMVRVVQENITGIRVIKALSKTEYETRRFGEVNQQLCQVDQKVGGITALTNPAATLILNLGLTGVVLAGAFRVNGGLTQPGVIIAFLNYFTMILNAMLGVTKIFIIWSKGEASAKRDALRALAENAPMIGHYELNSTGGAVCGGKVEYLIIPVQ